MNSNLNKRVICISCHKEVNSLSLVHRYYDKHPLTSQRRDGILRSIEYYFSEKPPPTRCKGLCFTCIPPLEVFGINLPSDSDLLYLDSKTIKYIEAITGNSV